MTEMGRPESGITMSQRAILSVSYRFEAGDWHGVRRFPTIPKHGRNGSVGRDAFHHAAPNFPIKLTTPFITIECRRNASGLHPVPLLDYLRSFRRTSARAEVCASMI